MTKRAFAVLSALLLSVSALAQSGSDHFNRGEALFGDGKWAAAQVEFNNLRTQLGVDDGLLAERVDYYVAICLSRLSDGGAEQALDGFTRRYPKSIYGDEIAMAKGLLYYSNGEWERAVSTLRGIDASALSGDSREEFNFKTGVSLFFTGNHRDAQSYLNMVSADGLYGMHAKYYSAYMEYAAGNYVAAKPLFRELAAADSYSQIAPYYLFQIEFLDHNYSYVTEHGDKLMADATPRRRAEIARAVGESYFHLEHYSKTLSYMQIYEQSGGVSSRRERYLTGYSKYMTDDYGGAIDDLILVYGPADELSQNAVYHTADCYMRQGEQVKAMQAFALAWALDFDEVIKEDALFNYGQLQYQMGGGMFNEAINILSRYIADYPRSPRAEKAREYLAAAYYNSNNFAAAYIAIKQIDRPDNNMRAALQKISYFRALEQVNAGELNEALVLLNESLANRANSKYTALGNFWKAEIFYRKGEYKSAIPLYRDFMLLSPTTEAEHVMANYNLAYCYFNLQQWDQAESYFDRFLKSYSAPDSYVADSHNRLGDISFAGRQFQKAVDHYNKALKAGTAERYYAQYQRAVMLGLVGKTEGKVESLRGIMAKNEGDYVADATYELGRTYMGMQRYADASKVLKGFIDSYPQSSNYLRALSNLGLISQNLGDNDQAMRYYKMVVERAPNSELSRDAMVGIRGSYMESGDMDEYFSYAKRSGMESDLGVVQKDSLSFAAAERQYLTAANKSKVEPLLRSYIKSYPNGLYLSRAHYYIAESRLASGDKLGAMEAYEKVADMYHNEHSVRSLDKLARLSWDAKQYKRSAAAYDKLSRESVDPAMVSEAISGYLRSVVAQGDHESTAKVMDEVLTRNSLTATAIREATYAKAVALEALGRKEQALTLYSSLATESKTLEGAVATYKVAEDLYSKKEYKKAQEIVVAMGKQGTPHTYWLGRAFVVLGDIYAAQGDNFQAMATYRSIVDGYAPSSDGVVAMAKERIERLK